MRWRFLTSDAAEGAWNMALDEALMTRARERSEIVLRCYRWSRPTLSLGRNQVARGAYDLERAHELGVAFVRRPTGGRALLHHREVTYSVTSPAEALGGFREAYDRVNRLLVEGLRMLGVPAAVVSDATAAAPPDTAPCFEEPSAGEIVAGGRKLVGSAQLREDGAMLQHGSILVGDDQALAAELLVDASDPPPPPATLAELLDGVPEFADVSDALVAAVRKLEDAEAAPLVPDDELHSRARLAAARYHDLEWTWRR